MDENFKANVMSLTLLPLGVGDAFTALHYTTCMALGYEESWILIDCPHPVRKMLREASIEAGLTLDLDRVGGVVLSHLHADHCCGLEDYAYYSRFVLGRRARVATRPEVASKLWSGVLSAGMGESRSDPEAPPIIHALDEYIDITELDESAPVAFGPFSVECRRTAHPVPTFAFRISAGGRTLGFSADSAFDPSLIAWLSPCDLILHEVSTLRDSRVHTPYRHLAELPADLRARMRLFHYSDGFGLEESLVEPLRQGRVVSF